MGGLKSRDYEVKTCFLLLVPGSSQTAAAGERTCVIVLPTAAAVADLLIDVRQHLQRATNSACDHHDHDHWLVGIKKTTYKHHSKNANNLANSAEWWYYSHISSSIRTVGEGEAGASNTMDKKQMHKWLFTDLLGWLLYRVLRQTSSSQRYLRCNFRSSSFDQQRLKDTPMRINQRD